MTLALLSAVSTPSPARAEAKTLEVCTADTPYFFSRGEDGPAGLEYDILSSFSEQTGRPLEITWLERSSPGLRERLERCPILALRLTRTAERIRQGMVFSEAYFPVRGLVVERKGETSASIAELAGKKVATVGGTVHVDSLESLESAVDIVLTPDVDTLFEWLVEGRVQAAVYDSWVVAEKLIQHEGLEVRFPLDELEYFAFVFPERTPLVEELDRHLRSLVADGRFFTFLESNFGTDLAIDIEEALGSAEEISVAAVPSPASSASTP